MSSDVPDVAAFLPSAYYDQYKLTVYDNLFVGIVYGVYIVLYVTSVHILLGKPGFTSSRPRMFMFGITTFMFVLGIIALALETALGFQQMQGNYYTLDGAPARCFHAVFLTQLKAVQYILSDVICAWRAVVLWNRDKRVIAILLLLILGATAAAGCELGLGPLPPPSSQSNMGPLIMVGPTLATNLLSTGLIAWKAWQHRVSVRKHLGEGNGSVRVERVFALLIESGLIYVCPWILYLISAFRVIPDPGFTVMEHVLLFISGLYPTLIIILVAMQKSPLEYYSTYSTRMQFASAPALKPPRSGDMSRHVYMIHRECASDSDMQAPSMVFVKTSDEEKGL